MEYIVIASVCLLIGFIAGFVLVSFLAINNENETQAKENNTILESKNLKLISRIEKLQKENAEMEKTFLKLLNQHKNGIPEK
jgi:hypothetical protein